MLIFPLVSEVSFNSGEILIYISTHLSLAIKKLPPAFCYLPVCFDSKTAISSKLAFSSSEMFINILKRCVISIRDQTPCLNANRPDAMAVVTLAFVALSTDAKTSPVAGFVMGIGSDPRIDLPPMKFL